ncbi:UDP-N-acetylmuramoyl-tripeptide--D-alanyl-D-alanine ligase [Winogradskyella sp. 3972H.M.0a.05]|uniref:UDP-N-acetylmuramoyl-tripeptide--D-alanyl-D- alanine ligase n=1 Tax=Winogradskyella sp. 3972H.M.0a.05 TaxID=2950277 RepID=UPI0033976575
MTIASIYNHFLECDSVCTDTRKISKNCLFFALKGENFNGNTFADEALEQGAKYCIVDEEAYAENENSILVEDVLTTLQDLARYHREQLGTPIIALTGSNGKTTTKELINAVLKTKYQTLATKGNLNNHIGVPLTLLSLTRDIEIGIVEMGANHKKEIEFLCNIALPDYGLITNFGKAHLEGFGGFEGVIEGKSELYKHLIKHNKLIFINSNDALQKQQINDYSNYYSFGNTKGVDVNVLNQTNGEFVSVQFGDEVITSNLSGIYNFNNIAVAITIGNYFNVSVQQIKEGIESYIPSNNRSQIIENNSNKIVLDAYNANPTSMKAAIDNFKLLKSDAKYALLGDMFELGSTSNQEHQEIMSYAETEIDGQILFVGENFFPCNPSSPQSLKFKNFDDLEEYLQNKTIQNSLILIKGSRGMALERALPYLNN